MKMAVGCSPARWTIDRRTRRKFMSDSTDTPRERKPLGLKRSIDAGEVKQTFSHGRTNKVVVEVKRRRLVGKPGEAAPAPVEAAPPPPPPPPPPPAAPVAKKAAPSG